MVPGADPAKSGFYSLRLKYRKEWQLERKGTDVGLERRLNMGVRL